MSAVVSLSGGIDSAVALAEVMQWGLINKPMAVSFRYPSKHNKMELKSASAIAKYYGVHHLIVNATFIFKPFESDLLLSGGKIPEGHYKDETMKSTVVPARNLIFASILSGIAASQGYKYVVLGVHQGDHYIYPDCRPEFVAHLRETVKVATSDAESGMVIVSTPFLYEEKHEIVKRGLEMNVPFHLTRTCYKSQEKSCGKCGSCVERLEAFQKNDRRDPIQYA